MTGMRRIRVETVATLGLFLFAPPPLSALTPAAQDDFGIPTNPAENSRAAYAPDRKGAGAERNQTMPIAADSAKQSVRKSAHADRSDRGAKYRAPEPARQPEAAQFRVNLALSDLKKLASIDKWFVRAAWNVIKKTDERKQTLLSYAFYDVNGDGAFEAVVLAQSDRRGAKSQSIAVYAFGADMAPILRFEHRQNIAATVTDYARAARASDAGAGVAFCEDWRIASWQFRECHDILFDALWQPRVRAYEITTREPLAHASQTAKFDFSAMRAARAYTHIPEGTFLPARAETAQYEMYFAPCEETGAAAPVPDWRAAQFGTKSDPMQYRMHWNDDALYISLDCADDEISEEYGDLSNKTRENAQSAEESSARKPSAELPADGNASPDFGRQTLPLCNDALALQTADHVEVWIDLAPALQVDRNAPQTWQADYEKSYHQSPYRREIDADIYAFAVTAQGCIAPIHPIREYWRAVPAAQIKTTPRGYRVDIRIPADFFPDRPMQKIAGPQGLGMSLIQHDIRKNGDFGTSLTSQWRWADPFTFGQVWLTRPNLAAPIFPFEWNKFLAP